MTARLTGTSFGVLVCERHRQGEMWALSAPLKGRCIHVHFDESLPSTFMALKREQPVHLCTSQRDHFGSDWEVRD